MKFATVVLSALSLSSAVNAAVIPEEANSLIVRADYDAASTLDSSNTLEKRKGGGGGGRGGGSSSGSSGSSSGSRGSGSSSSGSSGSSGSTSGTSNSGGRTSSGSGVRPSYGGGNYYAGGAASPYRAGARSPGGVAPYLLGGAALGFGAYALWAYPWSHPYYFHNRTEAAQNATYGNSTNTTLPVECVCAQYQECGCEDQQDDSYLASIVGNGSAADMNSTVARVVNVNGTDTLVINGTLPNGTTAAGASGDTSAAAFMRVPESAGMWLIAAGVGAFVYAL